MSDSGIQTIVMPKWGLAMQEGMVAAWHVDAGRHDRQGPGDHGHRDLEDRQRLRESRPRASSAAGWSRPARRCRSAPCSASSPTRRCRTPRSTPSSQDFQEKFKEQLAAEATAKGPEPETVEVGGRRLRYLAAGEGAGDPVLFLHGFGGDLNNWMFNQPAVAEQRHQLRPRPAGPRRLEQGRGRGHHPVAGRHRPGLLGRQGDRPRRTWSATRMGGAVALELALAHPDRVASATLVCPAGLGPDI